MVEEEKTLKVWIDPNGGLAYHKKDCQRACTTYSNHQYILVDREIAIRKGYQPCPACYRSKR